MEYTRISSTASIKTISEDSRNGVFEVEGLYSGYGLTVGNALRRVLLSSLPGAAVTYVKIKNAPHEFTTLHGIKENVIGIILNLKKLRFIIHSDEKQVLSLKEKGEKIVKASEIKPNSLVEIVNPDQVIATLTDKKAELDAEITVERGIGYSAVESRKYKKLPVGTIAVDAFFSPVRRVNYTIEDMRVGDRTDYNRLRIEIETDGTISPSAALRKSASILKDHFDKVYSIEVKDFDSQYKNKTGKSVKKSKTGSKKANSAKK